MTRRLMVRPHDAGHSQRLAGAAEENARLTARVAELEREREHLVAVVDILQGIADARGFVEILQTIARKLGETYGLDRCSVYLADAGHVRLMATYEDPTLSNVIVDIARYPELRHALASGDTVFIPDAPTDPMLQSVFDQLTTRTVRSILVAPIRWRGSQIGAIFLRTERDAAPFTEHDVRFCQVIASLTATALRNAHRHEADRTTQRAGQDARRAADVRRATLLTLVRRLVAESEPGGDEGMLPGDTLGQIDRLADAASELLEDAAR
jgi:two-component system, sensor histidine kinase ChiS